MLFDIWFSSYHSLHHSLEGLIILVESSSSRFGAYRCDVNKPLSIFLRHINSVVEMTLQWCTTEFVVLVKLRNFPMM